MKTINFLLVLVALLLAVITTLLPSWHWYSIANETRDLDLTIKTLIAAAAVCVTACKILFPPLAVFHFQNKNIVAGLLLALFASSSLVITTSATRDFFNELSAGKNENINRASFVYQSLQTEIAELNDQIKTIQTATKKDAVSKYATIRRQAVDSAAGLKILRQARADKLDDLKNTTQTDPASTGSTFGQSLALTIAGKSWRIDAATITAWALHLGCILAVLAVTVWRPEETQNKPLNQRTPARSVVNNAATANAAPENLAPDQMELVKRIKAGEFNNEFKLKDDLITPKAIRGGYKRIKPVIDFLIAEESLRIENRKYYLNPTNGGAL